MPTITLTQFLIVATPIALPAMGDMLAAILAQDGFDKSVPWLNPVIAYMFLILASAGSAYVEGQLTADVSGLITVGTFLFSLGISGGLHALRPWLKWLDLLQTYFFGIVKAEEATYAKPGQVTTYAGGTAAPVPVIPISQQTTTVMPAVTVPPIQYPSAQMPAVNPADFPTLSFDLSTPQP